ncbi:MAG: hypothetical protein QF886_19060, partial [Planctomycetota bacterium]|nr:hypothetical protein [Planctomycetota bacterium]
MPPSVASRVVFEIKNPERRQFVLEALSSDKVTAMQDWASLRGERRQVQIEKGILFKQKKRMEIFQNSLTEQQDRIYDLTKQALEEQRKVQIIQAQMESQLVAIQKNERSNLL